jgi:hypothetical protein
MSDSQPSKRELLRSAIAPGEDCPAIERLETALTGGASTLAPELVQHLQTCVHCQTELQMLRSFQEDGPTENAESVNKVVELLQERSNEILGRRPAHAAKEQWWDRVFQIRWLAPATIGMATLLIVAGFVIEFRHSAPQLTPGELSGTGSQVLRSSGFSIVEPAGDLSERPKEIRWESVHGAARYEVRLLEVDRSEIWKTDTLLEHVEIPQDINSKIVPAKTLFCEVVAFDSSGRKIGETGLVRFRLSLHGGAN